MTACIPFRIGRIALPLALLLLGGCYQSVRVLDADGSPLEGVRVSTTVLTAEGESVGPTAETNAFGMATLPQPWNQAPEYISFYKPGYMRQTIGYPQTLKIPTVTMNRISAVPKN